MIRGSGISCPSSKDDFGREHALRGVSSVIFAIYYIQHVAGVGAEASDKPGLARKGSRASEDVG